MSKKLLSICQKDGILLASNNQHKANEFQRILAPLQIKLRTLVSAGLDLEVDETSKSFLGNARLKARTAWRLASIPSIADDSGLCVDALDGAPGIYSARFGGAGLSDQERVQHLLDQLAGIPLHKRQAHFHCALVLCYGADSSQELNVEAQAHGCIARTIRGEGGFGYDPVFIDVESQKSFAELPAQQKDQISHRGQALRRFHELLTHSG